MTEDGTVPTSRRVFNADGTLSLYVHILSNADQQADQYLNGQLVHRQIFKANADRIDEFFFPGTEIVSRRMTTIALTGEATSEFFSKDGTLLYTSTRTSDGKVMPALYAKSKIINRQTGANFLLTQVEEFNPGSDTPKRKLELDDAGHVSNVYIYRADGTLARVKHLQNGVVTSQENYDSSGTKVLSTTQGEEEQIDPALIRPIYPPNQEE
jgi:hypothetical protein